MALLLAEGFTFLPQGDVASAQETGLNKMGWEVSSRVSNYDDDRVKFSIVPDEIFPERNVCEIGAKTLFYDNTGSRMTYRFPAGDVPQKLVVGYVLSLANMGSPSVREVFNIAFGSASLVKTSASNGAPLVPKEAFFRVEFGKTGVFPLGEMSAPWGGAVVNSPLELNREYHFEWLIEKDTGRIRLYLDGVLTVDYTYSGTLLAKLTDGFTLYLGQESSLRFVPKMRISNVYALGIDAVHTGILGPAARVMEVAPETDILSQFNRDEAKYASDAELLRQSVYGSDFLTGSEPGTSDVFGLGLASVRANAASVFGVQHRVRSGNFDSDSHVLGLTSGTAATQDIQRNFSFTPSEVTMVAHDVSVDARSGNVWTLPNISDLTVGFTIVS